MFSTPHYQNTLSALAKYDKKSNFKIHALLYIHMIESVIYYFNLKQTEYYKIVIILGY